MKINFYHIDDIAHKAIATLLLKVIENKKRALIYSKDLQLLKQIDDGLWSFSKTKFLPHIGNWEKTDPLKHPIFLTDSQDNQNKADFLIKLDQSSDDFIKKFEKTFYFFGNHNLTQARKLWVYYKEKTKDLDYYKKENGKWSKIDI